MSHTTWPDPIYSYKEIAQQSNVHWQNQTFSKSMLAWSLQPFTTVFPLHFDRKNEERECLLFQWGPDIIEDLSGPLGDDDA